MTCFTLLAYLGRMDGWMDGWELNKFHIGVLGLPETHLLRTILTHSILQSQKHNMLNMKGRKRYVGMLCESPSL